VVWEGRGEEEPQREKQTGLMMVATKTDGFLHKSKLMRCPPISKISSVDVARVIWHLTFRFQFYIMYKYPYSFVRWKESNVKGVQRGHPIFIGGFIELLQIRR
jgi:hypothetical protein